MAGLDSILEMISVRRQEAEKAVIVAAQSKVSAIETEADETASKEYDDYMKKACERLEQELINAKSSVDGDMRRKQLAYKVEAVNEVVEKTLKKLDTLSETEYFHILEKLISHRLKSESGILYLNERDLKRIPDSFKKNVKNLAEKSGGTVNISGKAADIENGFVLVYGLISENCTFRDIIDADRDGVRDLAAKVLFGR